MDTKIHEWLRGRMPQAGGWRIPFGFIQSRPAFVAAVLCLMFLPACGKSKDKDRDKDKVIAVESDDAEMNAAIKRARSEVDIAIQILKDGDIESFSVKIPIQSGDQTEHFWLTDVEFKDGIFSGTINNYPETVHTVKFGDQITAKKEEISDWFYMKDGKMHGNYTLRVLLRKMPPEEAAKYKQMLAE